MELKQKRSSKQKHNMRLSKFDFGCGSTSDPAGGAYSAPQIP